jgi:TIR domain
MSESQKIEQSEEGPSRRASRGTPLVFISHDSRDAEVAEAFSKLLSSVSAGVLKSFRSSDRKGSQGIEYGVEWYPELMKKLESASDVVCLLTSRSLDRPWILYEAGVAKGKLDTPVYGIAVGIPLSRANAGPFAQFQNCDDKEASLTKLVMQLLARVPDSEPDREAVQMQVKSFKDRLDQILKQAEGANDAEQAEGYGETASVAKLFEEIKVMFQDMPSRLETRLLESGAPFRRRRTKRLHPMMFEELAHIVSDDPGDPIGLLMIASMIRDDMPWFYELIIEAYREAKAGNSSAAREAIHRARRAGKMMIGGPWMEEMGLHPREIEMLAMELPMVLDRYLHQFEEKAGKRSGKAKTEGQQ